MRRGISILLALLFGIGPLTAVLPGSEDAYLPACCRRNGMHHCAMAAQMAAAMAAISDGRTSVSAPTTCPYYPGITIAVLIPAYALTVDAVQLPSFIRGARVLPTRDSADLSGPGRTHAGRGPPAQA